MSPHAVGHRSRPSCSGPVPGFSWLHNLRQCGHAAGYRFSGSAAPAPMAFAHRSLHGRIGSSGRNRGLHRCRLPELSKLTRVCSYDRAGLGWSDPRLDLRDSNSIADQFHALLPSAQITGPIVLMGHSIAGLHLRAYVSRHPQTVIRLVLVDAATPEQIERLRPFTERFDHQLLRIKPLMKLGIGRLLRRCGDTPPGNVQAYIGWYQADNYCNPGYPEAFQREIEAYPTSVRKVVGTGPFGDLPIRIFSQDPRFGADGAALTYRFQESLPHLSSRSRRIIARNSTHYIQFDRPELLNWEVPVFLRQVRGEVIDPAYFGVTVVE